MSVQNTQLLEAVNEIKNKFSSDLLVYSHNAQRSPPSFANYYMDLSINYENGVKSCDKFCREQNILELVRELMILGFDKEVSMLKQYIHDQEAIKLILEAEILEKIEDEILAIVEDIRKHIFG